MSVHRLATQLAHRDGMIVRRDAVRARRADLESRVKVMQDEIVSSAAESAALDELCKEIDREYERADVATKAAVAEFQRLAAATPAEGVAVLKGVSR